MKLGLIGLGKMGNSMAKRLADHNHELVAYDINPEAVAALERPSIIPADSPQELVQKLSTESPKIIWLMVPSGELTEGAINMLVPFLTSGDIIIDGGNSNFNDTIRRAETLAEKGIEFIDCGTSGGLKGGEIGYSLMVGGKKEVYDYLFPIFESLGIQDGFNYVGPSGSGHFIKMVHNAIEYGMMQSIAEGMELIQNGPFEQLDLLPITHIWNNGSIIRSYLMELTEQAIKKDSQLSTIKGYVDDNGEGRWAVDTAIKYGVPFDTIAHSIFARFRSRQQDSFAMKVLAALRNEFGGHAVKKD